MDELELKPGFSDFGNNFSSKFSRVVPSSNPAEEIANKIIGRSALKEEMQNITVYLSEFKPSQIVTPFKGTSLLLSKDKSKFYFASREGRVAIARIENKEILLDVDLKEGTIWTIAAYQNDKFLFSGGQGGPIKKFLLQDLTQVDTLEGHTDEVNVILISSDEKKMYSTGDDGTILMWDITIVSPKPTKLYSHNGICYGLDLSADNRYLASVSGDRTVKVYDLNGQQMLKSVENSKFGTTWCVKITQKNTYLTFGDDRAMVYLYKFGTWEELRVFEGHTSRVRCMNATFDEQIIITGGIDHKIFLWHVSETRPGLEFTGHTDWVKALIVSEDDKFLYSMSDDCSIKTWKIPKFDNYNSLVGDFPIDPESEMKMGTRSPENLYFISKKSFNKIDRSNNNHFSILSMEGKKVVDYSINPVNDNFCFLIAGNKEEGRHYYNQTAEVSYDILIYEASDFTQIKSNSIKVEKIYTMSYSLDGKFLIFGQDFRCSIYTALTMEMHHIFRSHTSKVLKIVQTPNQQFLFSGDIKGVVKSYDFRSLTEIKGLYDPKNRSIMELLTTSDNEYLIVVHDDMTANVWATSKMIKVHSFRLEGLQKVEFLKQSSLLFCMMDSKLKAINFPSLSPCFEIEFESKPLMFAFSNDQYELTVCFEKEIRVYKNPTLTNTISVYGQQSLISNYFEYYGKLASGKLSLSAYSAFVNHCAIEPYHINVLHLYAYFNKIELLKKSIEDGTGFFVSRSGYSPLDICLEMNNEDCLDFFYRYIKKISRTNPLFLQVLGDSLSRICENLFTKSHKFLDMLLIKSIDSTLVKYHHTNKSLPIIMLSSTLFLDKAHQFMNPSEYTSDGTALQFLQTYFKMNMTPGSLESISLIRSIIKTDNENIFSSNFIQTVLNEKWIKIRKVLYIQAIAYLIYLALLSAYSSLFEINILYTTFALNILLILYEIGQMITGGLDYFSDLWNYLDIIRSSLMTLLFLQDLINFGSEIDILCAVVLFFSWIRGIAYFRLIKVTRYYINLIFEVVYDIFPFLTILFYSTIAFSLVFGRLLYENDTFFNYIKMSWEINVGGFDSSGYNGYMYIAFFLHTIVNPIILLNLLISIMGNTFNRVNSHLIVADGKELAGMILEGELIYFWKRNNKDRRYLHVCAEQNVHQNHDETTEILERIKKKVTLMVKNQNKVLEKIDTLTGGTKSGKDQIIEKILENQNYLMKKQEEGEQTLKNILKFVSK